MHADELDVDEDLVRRLLAEQFPRWAPLPLVRIEPSGTDNAIFRLGADLSVRLARRDGPSSAGGKEHDWLPRLAPLLPLEIPRPVAQGRPAAGYPWYWDVHRWIPGESAPVEPVQAARDLAGFVAALREVDPAGAPPGRGVPLAQHDTAVRAWLEDLGDAVPPRVTALWDEALAIPPWSGPPVWHHGDLDARNWLVRDGRICAVIDWACMGVGDPACDVMVAWKLHSAAARWAFREALPVDDSTWARARGWALQQAIGAIAYYTLENNRSLVLEGRGWLVSVLEDAPVRLAEYDDDWPRVFDHEARRIKAALGARALLVEHVGSTSVPGLAAKPRIDIVLAVADSADEPTYLPQLEEAGYVLRVREPEWYEHRLVGRVDVGVNLHVFTAGAPEIDRMLLFRDHLRADSHDRILYERTKRELAGRDWHYTQEYADAKTTVVADILARASAGSSARH